MATTLSVHQPCMFLDVNVLVELCLEEHVHHQLVNDWWARIPSRAWASCAITELGFMRVIMNAKVNSAVLNLSGAMEVRKKMKSVGEHRFWPTLTAPESLALFQESEDTIGFRQMTDLYLLATAKENHGKLATLDRGIVVMAGNENKKWCEWIE